MAEKTLKEVISGNIIWEDFVVWLNRKRNEAGGTCLDVDCSRGDFVVYFVNLLRDEVSSFIRKSCPGNSSAKKPTTLVTCTGRSSVNTGRLHENPDGPSFQSIAGHYSKQNDSHQTSRRNIKSPAISNSNTCVVNSVLNKSLDNSNKKLLRSHSALNGTIKYNNDHHNNLFKLKQCETNSSAQSTEKSVEETFLRSCHLSPIASELHSSKTVKNCGCVSEFDSPNNRMVHKDARTGCSKIIPVERATSSPCGVPFNIREHSFPAVGSPAKHNSSRRRRIKPTRLADSFEKGKLMDQNRAPNFGEAVRPMEPSTPFREDVAVKEEKDLDQDFRDLLRLEKQKVQQNVWNNMATAKSAQLTTVIVASPEIVKFRDELCILANVYSLLLDTNFICSIITEIQFIITLLNVQDTSEVTCVEAKEHSALGYFVSVHECVFFATAVLNQQRFFLRNLDKTSLKILLNNKRISVFTPDLWKYVCDLYEILKDNKSVNSDYSTFHSSVCFQSDTDNRENFPNDRTFVTFRKQRDAFYDILGIWEENHSSPGWSFAVALGPRVKNLLSMNDEPANFIHFARLFRSQLVGSCWRFSSATVEEESTDAMAEVIKCLKEVNPDKYCKLYERLVTPVKSSNSCVIPEFPGQQEFYRDFIIYGCHAVFNAHLVDGIWHEILHLNSSNFAASEVEDGDTIVDKDTKQSFMMCVTNLQLLAKFLGFVKFLPYRTKSKMPEPLLEKQVSVRMKSQPQIDVLMCVQEAIQSKKLILTLPWTVQYLSMVDSVSYDIPYYKEIVTLLFTIYRTLPFNSSLTMHGSFMLKVCLGWLFELPQLPEDFFYTWCMNENCNFAGESIEAKTSHSMTAGVDELDLFDRESLQALCPTLETLKWLLMSDINNLGNVLPHRHITPMLLATEEVVPSSSLSSRNLELHLEENFLEGQPHSIRKTIEFVSERIASSCVKYICSKPLIEIKEKALKTLESTFDSNEKARSLGNIPLESSLLSHDLKTYCQNLVPTLCHDKCSGIMPLLLAEDVSEAVTEMCVQIAVRLSLEKVNLWINSHITPALFVKHLSSEIDKMNRVSMKPTKVSHVLSRGWRDISEKDVSSPADTISIIRKLIGDVMRGLEVKEEEILFALNMVLDTLLSRRDLIPSAERVLGTLTVDLAFSLVAHHPNFMKGNVLKKFLSIWKTEEVETSHCFIHLICPRNIMILNNSSQCGKTWSTAASFLYFILINNLVPPNEFQSQCVAVFQQEWPMEILKHLALCFEEVVKLYESECSDADFVLLLELVSELCREMNNEDF